MPTGRATPEYTVNQEASIPTTFIQDSCLLSQNYGCFNWSVSTLQERWHLILLNNKNVVFESSKPLESTIQSKWKLLDSSKIPIVTKAKHFKKTKSSTVFCPVAALLHFNPYIWDMQIDLLIVACSVMAKMHVPDCSKCMFCFTRKLHRIGKRWIIHVIFGISNLFESWIP